MRWSAPFFLLAALLAPASEAQLTSEMLSGLTLRSIGPANMSGRFVDIAVVEKDPYVYYAASATGGVFKTENNGVTFTPVFEREGAHSVGDIAVHPEKPEIVWVGTGERANRQSSSWGDGVYKSIDAGKTWTHVGLRDSHHIGRIELHPTDPDVVYVAAMGHLWGNNEERGLYKSTDGGDTWTRVLFIDEMTGVVDVAMDPKNPDVLYAAAYQRQRKPFGFHGGGPGSGLFKSTDGGTSWTELRNGLPEGDYGRIGISLYRKDPRIVYVCIEQGSRYTASTTYEERLAGIYRSEDGGESFTHMSDWNPRPMYASQILVDPTDDQRI
ncbi:MAG: WD40/YVTN/BNR-like repeat-containing protein [Vicinamibacteria bacterium]